MKLLLDENTSYRALKLLKEHFPGSVHVNSVGVPLRTDQAIWQFAKEKGFIIVTFDSDFVQLATLRKAPPHILLLELKNPSYAEVAQALVQRSSLIEAFIRDTSADASAVMAISV